MMAVRSFLFVWGLLLIGMLLCPSDAHAQKIKDMFSKKMPEFMEIPDANFDEVVKMHTHSPGGDSALAYEIKLPRNWELNTDTNLSNYTLSETLLGDISVFYGPPRVDAPRSYFKIQASEMKYNITADQWFLDYVLSNGYTLEGLESFSARKVAAIHVLIDKDDTYYVYSVAQINGKRMILAQFFIPLPYWEVEGPVIHRCAETLKLLNAEESLIENMREYPFVDLLTVSYPESWKLRSHPIKTIDRMSVSFSNIRIGEVSILDGLIELELISSYVLKDVEEEIEEIKSRMREKGLIMGEVVESIEDFEKNENVEYGFVDIYEGSDTRNESLRYEIWIATLALKNYYGLAVLTTPNRDDEFFTWSRNVGAFKSIIKTLRLQNNPQSPELHDQEGGEPIEAPATP